MKSFIKILIHAILLFAIGGFFGYIFETFWELIKTKKIVNRQGLWYSVFKPIYGIGLILLTLLLFKLKDKNFIIIFICGIIIGTVFEYLASLFQEYIFHTCSWDYSKMSANLDGRVNLLYSFLWGILSLSWIKLGYPYYIKLFNLVYNHQILKIFTFLLLLFLIFDITITSLITKRYSKRKEKIPATTKLDKFIDKHYKNSVFEKKFPNMKLKT